MKRPIYASVCSWQSAVGSQQQKKNSSLIILALFTAYCLMPTAYLKAQCTSIACNNNVTLSLKDDCKGYVNPFFMIANPYACGGPSTIDYYDQSGIYLGDTLNEDHIGMTVNAFLTHEWTGLTCAGTVNVVDGRAPKVDCQNINIKCTEDDNPAALGEPYAYDNCTDVMSLEHEDDIIDLGCGMQGFQGYFDPSNWTEQTSNGDGGVDVTGAPNAVLVEGANSSPFKTRPRYLTRFRIAVPAEGYISFDWSSFGGSNFNVDAFYITINDVCIQLSFNDITSGTWQSWLLQPGDIVSFEQASDGTPNSVNTEVSNFQFLTTAQKIIHRTWTATDDFGNKGNCLQVITLERATLGDVHFPANLDGLQAPILNCGDGADPIVTGFPFLDDDGNLNTTFDQYPIENGDCTFSMTYVDQSIITCPGSEVILREWSILDDCNSQVLKEIQIIKLFDTTPPLISCPANLTLGTNTPECGMTVTLPAANATDDCTQNVNIIPSWSYGSGFGDYEDVAPGTYPVIYEATDGCGNSTSCTFFITVYDQHPPTVICDGFTVASLTPDGNALVFADVIDDGSYDLCCLDGFEVKRKEEDAVAYSEYLEVTCDDAGTSLLVHMRAKDCDGNSSFCEVEVMVEDQQAPALLAPADVTVDCNQDLSDLSVFGTASGIDNCNMTVEEQVEQIIGGCGQGSLIRTWIATDDFGNINAVSQTVTVSSQNPWNANNDLIIWPADYTTTVCEPNLSPNTLSDPFKEPSFLSIGNCESVSASWDDELLWISEPACYVVYRTWTVIDFCQYDSNSGSDQGRWEYVQTLTVSDNEPPVFLSQNNNLIYGMTSSINCFATVDLPTPLIDDCSDHILLSAQGDLGNGFGFSNVAPGTYNMTYFASDGCGNTSEHNFVVTVQDDYAPNALCANGFQIDLNVQGEYSISANLLDLASFDNCTTTDDLKFSFSANINDKHRTYTCDDLGQNQIQLYVTDENGNQGICQTNILVNDGFDNCLQNPNVIAGEIQTTWGEGISQVTVHLDGENMAPFYTNLPGDFDFEGDFEGNSYSVRPEKDINPNNGVSSFDLAKINDHILDKEKLDSPYKLIAADANNTGTITVADLVVIQRVILFIDDAFPNNTSWRFIPNAYSFPDEEDPFTPLFPEEIPLTSITGDILDANFIGIKIGDVSSNADPDVFTGNEIDDRNSNKFNLFTENQKLHVGEVVSLTFKSEALEQIKAFQFTLDFDENALEFLDFENTDRRDFIKPKYGTSLKDEGAITLLWYNDGLTLLPKQADLFTMNFIAKSPQLLSEVLEINSRYTKSAAFRINDELLDVELQFVKNESGLGGKAPIQLFQNVPNPFEDETEISFFLPEKEEVVLYFFDVSGKLLHKIENVFEAGNNTYVLDRRDLGLSAGLVFYELNVGGMSLTKKMILSQ